MQYHALNLARANVRRHALGEEAVDAILAFLETNMIPCVSHAEEMGAVPPEWYKVPQPALVDPKGESALLFSPPSLPMHSKMACLI